MSYALQKAIKALKKAEENAAQLAQTVKKVNGTAPDENGNVVVQTGGDSAYQVAVTNGFVGTESEWIASLKGAKGDKGDPGTASTAIDDTVLNTSQTWTSGKIESRMNKKTSFVTRSSNLFNKSDINDDYAIDSTTGNLIINTSFGVSNLIPIQPNTVYTGYRMARKAFYTDDGVFISTNTTDGTFTSPATAFYMRIQYNPTYLNQVQLNVGGTLLAYEEWWERLSSKTKISSDAFKEHQVNKNQIPNNVVSAYNVDFIKPSTNLYYYNPDLEGYALAPLDGTISVNSTYIVSDYIKVTKGQSYTFSHFVTRMAYYDFNKVHVKTYSDSAEVPKTNVADGDYVRIHFLKIKGKETIQINEGSTLLPYEKGGSTFNPEIKIPTDKVENLQESLDTIFNPDWATTHKFVTYDNFDKVFTCPDLPSMDETSGDFLHEYRSADFYTLYDELVTNYPDYVTKTLLGNDASGTLPIYRYDFKPADIITSNMAEGELQKTKFPKVILAAGSHPEFAGAYCTYAALKQITTRWQEDEALETLRWNVHFIVLPVWSPWSLDNDSRFNFNGVAPSRNFPYLFTVNTPGNTDYGGTVPLSEPETQYLYNVLIENQDAIIHIDFHNMGHTNNFIWMQANSDQTLAINKAHIVQMTRKWAKERSLSAPSAIYNGYVGYTNKLIYTSSLTQAETMGIRGLTYEITLYDLWDVSQTSYTSRVITLGTEAFVNYLLLILRTTIEEKNARY